MLLFLISNYSINLQIVCHNGKYELLKDSEKNLLESLRI